MKCDSHAGPVFHLSNHLLSRRFYFLLHPNFLLACFPSRVLYWPPLSVDSNRFVSARLVTEPSFLTRPRRCLPPPFWVLRTPGFFLFAVSPTSIFDFSMFDRRRFLPASSACLGMFNYFNELLLCYVCFMVDFFPPENRHLFISVHSYFLLSYSYFLYTWSMFSRSSHRKDSEFGSVLFVRLTSTAQIT